MINYLALLPASSASRWCWNGTAFWTFLLPESSQMRPVLGHICVNPMGSGYRRHQQPVPCVDAFGCLGFGQVGPGLSWPSETGWAQPRPWQRMRRTRARGGTGPQDCKGNSGSNTLWQTCPTASVHSLECKGAALWTPHFMATVTPQGCLSGVWPLSPNTALHRSKDHRKRAKTDQNQPGGNRHSPPPQSNPV